MTTLYMYLYNKNVICNVVNNKMTVVVVKVSQIKRNHIKIINKFA